MNTQPFLGILDMNESKFSAMFIVLKKVILQLASFDADSYFSQKLAQESKPVFLIKMCYKNYKLFQ